MTTVDSCGGPLLVIGALVDRTGNRSLAFSASIAVLVCSLVATLVIGSRMGFMAPATAETVGA